MNNTSKTGLTLHTEIEEHRGSPSSSSSSDNTSSKLPQLIGDEDFDQAHFMFVLKKIIDFTDNHCKCDDPINDKLCKFCYYLSHHKQKDYIVGGDAFDEITKHFMKELDKKLQ